jgi:hypothetical protein
MACGVAKCVSLDLVRLDWRGRGVSHDFALAGAFRRCPRAPAAPGDAVAHARIGRCRMACVIIAANAQIIAQ